MIQLLLTEYYHMINKDTAQHYGFLNSFRSVTPDLKDIEHFCPWFLSQFCPPALRWSCLEMNKLYHIVDYLV